MLVTKQLCQRGFFQALNCRRACNTTLQSSHRHVASVTKHSTARQITFQRLHMCRRSHNSRSVISKLTTTKSQSATVLLPRNCNYLRTCGTHMHGMTPKRTNFASQLGALVVARSIRTSSRHYAPPLLALLILKPIAKLGAVISGRAFRQWWKALPASKREVFLALLRKHKYHILGTVGGVFSISGLYYYTHLKATPITNRKRFLAFTESQFRKIAEAEARQMIATYDGKFVPGKHPVYKIVVDVTNKLIHGNQDLPQVEEREWTIYIVDEDVKNAFVLPNGEIFVFTGMLQAVDNNQQLAAVLSHEMAHVVLSHAAELVSFFNFIDFLLIVVLAGLWAFLPNDGIALVASWFKNRVIELLLEMPYNRNLESEADEVGLRMAAKSCFDVREGVAFWEGMALYDQDDKLDVPELLSTHPSSKNRAEKLSELMPNAIDLCKSCNCPALPKRDPMVSVERLRKRLEQERSAKETTQPQGAIKGGA